MAITGAIQGTSCEKLYKELGLESLQSTQWYRKKILFHKILHKLTPKYKFDIIPVSSDSCYNTIAQSKLDLTQLYSRTKSFSDIFFPFCITKWNKLDAKIRNLPSVFRFKKLLLIYFKTDENLIFGVHNPQVHNVGIKLLNRLGLNFSHLKEHKLRHNFLNTVN